jgi:hypothetical protein
MSLVRDTIEYLFEKWFSERYNESSLSLEETTTKKRVYSIIDI